MKKVQKGGITLIKGTVFPYDIIVALGVTKEELFKYSDKEFENGISQKDKDERFDFSTCRGKAIRLDNNALILWLKEFPTSPQYHGHLAHEIFHIADMILDKIGVTHSNDSDEVWAYLIDWITKIIYERFKLVK